MGRPRATKATAVAPPDEDEAPSPKRSTRTARRGTDPVSNKSSKDTRRKQQSIVLSSDEDETENQYPSSLESSPEPPSVKSTPRKKAAVKVKNGIAGSKHQSPRKSKTGSSTSLNTDAKPTKTLYSFFQAAPQGPPSRGSISPEKRNPSPDKVEEEEDLIQDDSMDEDLAKKADEVSAFAVPVRKRKLEQDVHAANGLLQGSQKFLKTSGGRPTIAGTQRSSDGQLGRDNRPWIEKYGPINLDELAVHKKKISDVHEWLSEALSGRSRKRLLVLKGSAGTGKTTTVKLLARQLGLNVKEWHNPTSTEHSSEGFVSVASQFDDFIGNSGRFGALEMAIADRPVVDAQPKSDTESDHPHITMVEEFPNAFTRSSSSLQAFRSTVARFLASNTPTMDALFSRSHDSSPSPPLVMIVTESMLTNSTSSLDSFTATRLLGAEILNHPGATVIEFNPVAFTFLVKALELVIRKEARESGRRRAPGPGVLKHLSEIGDVRSAVSALEFLCLRGDDPYAWSGRVAATAQKGRKGSTDTSTLTDVERKSLEIITQRENALGIFHAVGKVVYNKREAPAATDTPPPQPPAHLPQHVRRKVPENDADTLIDELGTDIQTFVAALHENYVLSCCSISSEHTQDVMNGCIDSLSDADLLCSDNLGSSRPFRRVFQGASTDSLRQEELSFQVAVRGLQFDLPYPVKRVAPPASVQRVNSRGPRGAVAVGGASDAAKMYFPTSLKLWRNREEVEGLIDVLLDKAQRGQLVQQPPSANGSSPRKTFGTSAFKQAGASNFPAPSKLGSKSQKADDRHEDASALLHMGGTSAKAELVLERLPYVGMVYRGSSGSKHSTSALLKQIESVTHMTGMVDQDDDDSDTGEEVPEGLAFAPQATLVHRMKKGEDLISATASKEQALVLSDDDIEDD